MKAYIGLGSNLDGPAGQIRRAFEAIAAIPGVTLLARSSLYRSPPMGPKPQPDYCNAVCAVESRIPPMALLHKLLQIEQDAGRVRIRRWGARCIDLDLLHVDGVTLRSSALRLPHPGIATRNFVLHPLAEIAPDLCLPGLGCVSELAAGIDASDLCAWDLDAPAPTGPRISIETQ